jgi:ABC-type Mn2+/Zn2+ transport system permease subunit
VSGWSFDKMGLLAAVPYLFMAIVVQCQGLLADLLRTRFKVKTTTVISNYLNIPISLTLCLRFIISGSQNFYQWMLFGPDELFVDNISNDTFPCCCNHLFNNCRE